MRKIQEMRYGENPHQKGAFYQAVPAPTEPCVANALQLQGKDLSFNNILDANCAIECIKEFSRPACVIIKHATPCGIACAANLFQAWQDAYATDVYSPFGGIVAFNRTLPKEVALELSKYYLEVIIAPGFAPDAVAVFKEKKNLRLLKLQRLDNQMKRAGLDIRGGDDQETLQEGPCFDGFCREMRQTHKVELCGVCQGVTDGWHRRWADLPGGCHLDCDA